MVKETGRGQADREMRTVSAEQGVQVEETCRAAQIEEPCQAEKAGRFAQMAQQTEESRQAVQSEQAGQAANPAEPGVCACDAEGAGASDLARPQHDQTSPARPGTIEGGERMEQADESAQAARTEEICRAAQMELAGQATNPAEPGVCACGAEGAGASDLARPQHDQTSSARPGKIEGASSTEQAGPPVRIAVLVSGGGTNLQALIDAQGTILTDGKIALVVSNRADAYALTRAARAGIPTAVLLRKALGGQAGFEAALTEVLEAHGIEMLVLAGFMTILSAEFTERWPKRILNVHPSLIPKFCGPGFYGLHVHEAVLAAGETVTGATVHYVNEIPDGGEILLQKEVPVEPGDTPESLQRRVMEQAEWILLPQAVESVARRLRAERAEKRDGVEQAER